MQLDPIEQAIIDDEIARNFERVVLQAEITRLRKLVKDKDEALRDVVACDASEQCKGCISIAQAALELR